MSTQTTTVVNLGAPESTQIRSKSLYAKALYRIRRDRITVVAGITLVLLALLAFLAPFITTQILNVDYTRIDLRNTYADVGSPGHVLGTDEQGRDHLARLLYAGRVSLGIAFSAASIALTIGVTLGIITGYYGGPVDDLVIWFITTLNSIPQLFLLLSLSAALSPGPLTLVLILAFLSWTGTTRLVRGETFSLREREFVVAARAIGAGDLRIMFIHILPNVISLVIVTLALSISGVILAESALSYLGFGVPASTAPSWGNMLNAGLDLIKNAPHLVIAPGMLIMVTVLCLYLIGDGIRDAFDPKLSD